MLEALALFVGGADACVTDPPYHLGFMNKQWDRGDLVFQPQTWCAVSDALKPGAHLIAFGGTRTAHRMTCAIEDAGFEIRDTLCWLHGQGFPKSRNIGDGWGTALKPAFEPIILARKPLSGGTVAANILAHGTGAINVEGCRVAVGDADARDVGRQITRNVRPEDGWGMNSVEAESGVCVVKPEGRWPANVLHDGSDEVLTLFPQSAGQQAPVKGTEPSATGDSGIYGHFDRVSAGMRGDRGSSARFFYCAKASATERKGSKHPTIKPLALMRWLVRLITPSGGVVLDPFAGSGTTGEAALLEGFMPILIECEAEYVEDICRRLGTTS